MHNLRKSFFIQNPVLSEGWEILNVGEYTEVGGPDKVIITGWSVRSVRRVGKVRRAVSECYETLKDIAIRYGTFKFIAE